jgi:carboxynorspermidine decarboxylase
MIDPFKIPSSAFVIEEELLENNLKVLEHVQRESGATIILALKGFAMHGVFDRIRRYLKGVTASSLHEARLGHEAFGGEIHAYCPVYFEEEFSQMAEYCSHMTFNSLSQWEYFRQKVSSLPKKISCGLRINPEYSEIKTDLYNPAGPGSRLGIPSYHLQHGLPEGIEGLHFHTLFENNSDVLERTLNFVEERFGHLFTDIKWLNLGGGHGITQKNYDVDKLIGLVKKLRKKYGFEVILEPGSAIAWETGTLVSTVVDVVENHGRKTAMLDVSFAAHMPDCIEMPYKPRIRGARDAHDDDEEVYSMGGTTCLAGDVMHGYAFEKPLKPGDKIIFEDMIHYTMVKTTTFNGVKHPSIGMWTTGGEFKLFREFGYEDFRDRLS